MYFSPKLAIGISSVWLGFMLGMLISFVITTTVPPYRPLPVPRVPIESFDTLRSLGVYVVRTTSEYGSGFGSGFSVSDTLIVTAHHVIRDVETILVDGEVAEVIAFDRKTDVAVLRVPSHPRPHLEFADPAIGDKARAVGYAGYHGKPWVMIVPGQVAGFVDGYVTFAGGVGSGMSGGPLLDTEGRVIGLASHAFMWRQWGTPNPTLANFVPPRWIIMVLAETPFYVETVQ
ncbi:hypothetical protein LCGC14_1841030 [marine sediment metagenome]|uniref:Serine protease n=1 Tax=marine sediment metagenome TaxID=412755 RepID=A0A0F9GDA0_9ZZZZ